MNTKSSIYAKYFWGLNKRALNEVEIILNNPVHSQFIDKTITILSRCQDPKELFFLISKERFINHWPRIRNYWRRINPVSDFRDWWQTIYEELVYRKTDKLIMPKGMPLSSFLKFGKSVKKSRIAKGLSQKDLACSAQINQSDVSLIEEGRKNITFKTLFKICKALEIKNIEI